MSYKAIIAKVYTRPHENADRIQLGECRGYTVVVGKDIKDGQLGVLFPPGGALSKEYCLANNLYARHPDTGEAMGGFFDKHGRVKAQRFRGEKSEAYFASLESVYKLAPEGWMQDGTTLKEGEEINSFAGVPLCQKYETPATRAAKANRGQQARRVVNAFKKHFDTEQLRKYVDTIPAGALLYFTEKLHGTSGRSGYVLDNQEPTFLERLRNKIFGHRKTADRYEHLLGTRNVVLGKWEGDSYYGKEGFRYKHHDAIKDKLRKGETVYYELVGYTENGSPIMPSVSTKSLPDIQKKYGKTMYYHYGNWEADSPAAPIAVGGSDLYVYRITQQNAEGIPIELSWEQVKGRCSELGVRPVPQIGNPILYGGGAPEELLEKADELAQGPSLLDPLHIREGVALRWEKDGKMGILKHKSFEFLVLEGVVKAQDDYIDMEEVS